MQIYSREIVNKIILSVIGVALCVLFVFAVLRPDAMDRHVLLEKRSPRYFDNLSSHALNVVDYTISNDVTETDNYFISSIGVPSNPGISVHQDNDGTITATGATGDTECIIALSAFLYLPQGIYKVTDGGVSSDAAFLYGEGWGDVDNFDSREVVMKLPEEPTFTVDNKFQAYKFQVRLALGFDGSVSFHPGIYRVNSDTAEKSIADSQQPYLMKGTSLEGAHIRLIYLTEDEFNRISDKEWNVFNNSLKYQYKDTYDHMSILFVDDHNLLTGDGVAIGDEIEGSSYGRVNSLGFLENSEGSVVAANGGMVLQ